MGCITSLIGTCWCLCVLFWGCSGAGISITIGAWAGWAVSDVSLLCCITGFTDTSGETVSWVNTGGLSVGVWTGIDSGIPWEGCWTGFTCLCWFRLSSCLLCCAELSSSRPTTGFSGIAGCGIILLLDSDKPGFLASILFVGTWVCMPTSRPGERVFWLLICVGSVIACSVLVPSALLPSSLLASSSFCWISFVVGAAIGKRIISGWLSWCRAEVMSILSCNLGTTGTIGWRVISSICLTGTPWLTIVLLIRVIFWEWLVLLMISRFWCEGKIWSRIWRWGRS